MSTTTEKLARAAATFETTPLAATVQHIELLHAKRERLTNALVEAHLQFLAALRREYDAGRASFTELRDAYDILSAAQIPGVMERWNDAIPVSAAKARAHAAREPDAVDGGWRGTYPLEDGESYPLNGRPVVYVLFDANHVPVYVGSTGRFKARMDQHHKAGKVWKYWLAHPCRDREHAYDVEARFLRQYMPSLNVQRPRKSGGAA